MIIDLETLFPNGVSDETVSAISEVLNEIAQQWESAYFHRLRDYYAQQQADLFDSHLPWQKRPADL